MGGEESEIDLEVAAGNSSNFRATIGGGPPGDAFRSRVYPVVWPRPPVSVLLLRLFSPAPDNRTLGLGKELGEKRSGGGERVKQTTGPTRRNPINIELRQTSQIVA